MIVSSDSFKFLSLLSFFEKGEFKMNQFDFFFSNLPIKISYLPATLHTLKIKCWLKKLKILIWPKFI